MKPPHNAKLYEGELATFWFEENGILCAMGKPTERTLERQKSNYEFIQKITGDKKVCLLSDNTLSKPQDKETRDYMANELPNLFKAMAVISRSSMGEYSTNVFVTIKDQPIPIRTFGDEKAAKEWLKEYL